MVDNSEKDGHAEIIMDYVLSWCLRVAASDYCKKSKPILYRYCRVMLLKLLKKEEHDKFNIEEVKVWKQWERIDLCVEVKLKEDEDENTHVILIENKYYTHTHNTKDADGEYRNQLEVYKKVFDNYYDQKNIVKENRHYIVITCLEKKDFEDVEKYGYELLNFYDLLDNQSNYEPTESDIFNEFWIEEW